MPLLHFEGADFISASDHVNGVFRLDRDLDGEGDLTERALNDTAWLYLAVSQPLNETSTLALRLSASLDSANEDAGFDTFQLVGSSCPDPSTPVETSTMLATSSMSPTSTSVKVQTISLAPVLPFVELFDSSAQMTLSHSFAGDSRDNYFGIANGDNSDFGQGSTSPIQYEGEAVVLTERPCHTHPCDT